MNDPENTLENLLTRPENIYCAWNKFQRNIRYGNILYDEIEVAQFEANLKQKFDRIIEQFKSLTHQMGSIRPLPHPKKPDENRDVQARQSFWIPVRDCEPIRRTIYRHEGNGLFTAQVVSLPVRDLDKAQKEIKTYHTNSSGVRRRQFKHTPPGYRTRR